MAVPGPLASSLFLQVICYRKSEEQEKGAYIEALMSLEVFTDWEKISLTNDIWNVPTVYCLSNVNSFCELEIKQIKWEIWHL